MIHLTYTGPWAGQTLCGERRNEADRYVHAVYGGEKYIGTPDVCANCEAMWHASGDEEEQS